MVRIDAPALTAADRGRIADAVKMAERRTAAEIVVVIETDPCEETDATVALIAAGFLTIAAAGPLSLLDLRVAWLIAIQALIFAVLASLASSSRVRRTVGIDRISASAAHEAAERAFVDLGVGRTRERTGVLIHVAIADRHVEVLADDGVHAAVASATWSESVTDIVQAAKAGRLADGIVAAIERCGATLAEALPPQPGLGDELPNEPVTR